MDLNVTTMPFIIFVTYFSIWGLKKWVLKDDKSRKNLPPIAAAIGCAVSIFLYFFFPNSIHSTDFIECCTTGMASGLASVGFNQILKQYKRFNTADVMEPAAEEVTVNEEVIISEAEAKTEAK